MPTDAVEERHPDRDAPDEQRRHSRGDGLLRPREAAVAEEEEQASEDEAGEDLRAPDPVALPVSAGERPREEERAGEQVPDGHGQERWQVAHGDRERDEGRAPDEVDRHGGEPDPRRIPSSHEGSMPVAGLSAQVDWPAMRSVCLIGRAGVFQRERRTIDFDVVDLDHEHLSVGERHARAAHQEGGRELR